MRAIAEDYPATVTHWMPEGQLHFKTLTCWCAPLIENNPNRGGTSVKHSVVAARPFTASKSD